MSTEQTPADSEASVIDRLAGVFAQPEEPEAAPEQQTEQEDQPEEFVETDEPEEAQEGEAFEVDGVEYRLPAELKSKVAEWREGALRREDYTRKTQEIGELHRQVNAMAETTQAMQEFDKSVESERRELERVKTKLEDFKSLEWGALEVEQYVRLKGQMDTLRDRAGELEQTIGNKRQEFSKWVESRKREIIQSGQKYLQQSIKGWGPEAVKEVSAAAKEVGYTDGEIENVLDARFVRLAWEAAQFRKIQAGKPAAVQSAQKAPPVVKPGGNQPQQAVQRDKALRAQVKKTGDLKDVARLLASRMR